MSLPYRSSIVEPQHLSHRPSQSPSMLFSSDSASSTRRVPHSHATPVAKASLQEQFHSFRSTAISAPPVSEAQTNPIFDSTHRENRHHRLPSLPFTVSPVSDCSSTGHRHRSPVGYPTSVARRLTPAINLPTPLRMPYQDYEREARNSTNGTDSDRFPSNHDESYAKAPHRHANGAFSRRCDPGGATLTASTPIISHRVAWEDSHLMTPSELPLLGTRTADRCGDLYRQKSPADSLGEHWLPETDGTRTSFQPVHRLPLRLTTGMLPNREYYPSPHHQNQFDALYLQDASILQERENLGLNTLDCEFGRPPQHSMPIIIECAILGSPQQKLTLSELRLTLKRRFRYYEQEEEKGIKSWERTLLQNLSKKTRFINTERSMSEPGQGGYWQVNHNAPPPNRARKRNIRRLASPLQASTSASPIDQTHSANPPTLDGPSSLFRSVPAELLPGGRANGMNDRCIVLPRVQEKPTEVTPSSPRRWIFTTMVNNI
ncbi:hypothetical protein JB92DRAFT_3117131 [Gautieria morchelliformis]|nr:hypothetical protein JB92DRAFT_3117131 [Gautieria morchelliformis]